MPTRNLVIGFGASALVLGSVGAIASGIDWDPRDVAASEQYRQQERQRAERYRSELGGTPAAPTASEGSLSRAERRAARAEAREKRHAEHARWWDETVEGVAGAFEVGGWRGVIEDWGSWWRDEAGPAWEEWAERQEARVADSEHFTSPPVAPGSPESDAVPSESRTPSRLPAAVERILEESLPPEEMDAVRRGADEALDWWAEERARMRAHHGSGGER